MADSVTLTAHDENGVMEVTASDPVDNGVVTVIHDSTVEEPVVESVGEDDIIQQALDDASGTGFNVDGTVQIHYTADGVALQEGQFLAAGEEGVAFITSDGIVSGSDVQLVQNYDGSTFQVVNSVADDDNVALQIVNRGPSDGREMIVIQPVGDGPHNGMFREITTAPSETGTDDQVVDFNSSTVPAQVVSGHSYEENIIAAQTITDTGQQYQHAQKPFINYTQTIGRIGVTSSPVIQSQPNVNIPQSLNVYPPKSSVPLSTTPKSNAPLGSSTNPIRIIQQGNQYTPVQNLSQDQLQQIMQVVQQQQIAKSGDDASVLYNSQTNTRIVYRVIHPSDLHKNGSGPQLLPAGQSKTKNIETTMKRPYKKRIPDEERLIDGPELTREEKEQRKKMRPKTRSGRISKPPKHMVKDFKHIHVLDYDEDYDDSDGGYSDFKVSDGDEEDDANKHDTSKEDGEAIGISGLSLKPKKHKCAVCDKAYIGPAGLDRHFRLFPSHINLEPDDENSRDSTTVEETTPTTGQTEAGGAVAMCTEGGVPNSQLTPVAAVGAPEADTSGPVANGCVSTANSNTSFSEDSRDSTSSLHFTTTPPRRRGRGRPPNSARGIRGRGGLFRGDIESRRKHKLQDIVRECSDEELMEAVLPRLVRVITLWEFLLMKVEGGCPARPNVGSIYTEYERLHERVQQLCQKYLEFVPNTENNKDVQSVQVQSSVIADALGMKVGRHIVREVPEAETLCQFKFLTTDKSLDGDQRNSSTSILKRTVDVVSPSEMLSPSKKPKLVSPGAQASFQPSFVKILPNDIVPPTTSAMLSTNINKNMNSYIKIVPKTPSTCTSIIPSVKVNSVPTATSGINKPNVTAIAASLPNVHVVSPPSNGQSRHIVVNSSSSLKPAITSSSAFKSVSSVGSRLVSSHISPPTSYATPQKYVILSGKDNVMAVDGNPQTVHAINSTVAPVANAPQGAVVLAAPNNRTLPYGKAVTPVNCVPFHSAKPDGVKNTNGTNMSPIISFIPANSFPNSVSTLGNVSLLPHTIVTTSAPVVCASAQPVTVPAVPVVKTLPPGAIVLETLTPQQLNNVSASKQNIKHVDLNSAVPSVANQDGESVITITVRNGTICSEEEADYQGMSNGDASMSNLEETGTQSGTVDTAEHAPNEQMEMTSDNGVYYEDVEQGVEMGDDVDIKPDIQQSSSTNETLGPSNNSDTLHSSNIVCQPEEPVVVTNGLGDRMEGSVQYEATPQFMDESGMVHVPATIYQTEDGAILIQNPDGTMVQLQGADGQNIPLETVHALMAMDSETQFVTETTDTTGVNVHE